MNSNQLSILWEEIDHQEPKRGLFKKTQHKAAQHNATQRNRTKQNATKRTTQQLSTMERKTTQQEIYAKQTRRGNVELHQNPHGKNPVC